MTFVMHFLDYSAIGVKSLCSSSRLLEIICARLTFCIRCRITFSFSNVYGSFQRPMQRAIINI
jgi:hypothetical protein